MVLCALLVGLGAGLINGALIAYGRLVPFIVTLAMLVSARGLAAKMADNQTQIVNVADHQGHRPRRTSSACPDLVVIFAVVVARRLAPAQPHHLRPTHVRHRRQRRGRPARRHRRPPAHAAALRRCPASAAASPPSCSIARTTTGSSTHGNLYELDAIAAVIIGGTLLTRRPRHADRLDPRRPRLHDDHEHLHPQQPGDRGPEHRQGPDHRRRRAAAEPGHPGGRT